MQSITLPKQNREGTIDRLCKFLLALPEKAYRVEVKEHRNTRSIQQCRYLNGVAYKLLSEATGYERDDISEYMCGQYFGWRTKKVPRKPGCKGTEEVPVRTTTTNESGEREVLSKMEFVDFVAFVQRFAAERGVFIPDPEET